MAAGDLRWKKGLADVETEARPRVRGRLQRVFPGRRGDPAVLPLAFRRLLFPGVVCWGGRKLYHGFATATVPFEGLALYNRRSHVYGVACEFFAYDTTSAL